METHEYLGQLGRDVDEIVQLTAVAELDGAVATCPEWTVRELLSHLGGVQRWATAIVSTAATSPGGIDRELPAADASKDELVNWFSTGATALLAALEDAPHDLSCWTLYSWKTPREMWTRRQAHESAVHRVDVALATERGLTPFPNAFAVDGIDELLRLFAPRSRTLRSAHTVTLGVVCDDLPDQWTVSIGPDGPETTDGVECTDCTLSGSANALYLTLWNRIDRETISIDGDPAIFDLFATTAFTR